jgi:hypothetical protein
MGECSERDKTEEKRQDGREGRESWRKGLQVGRWSCRTEHGRMRRCSHSSSLSTNDLSPIGWKKEAFKHASNLGLEYYTYQQSLHLYVEKCEVDRSLVCHLDGVN